MVRKCGWSAALTPLAEKLLWVLQREDMTTKQLAERFGMSPRAILERCSRMEKNGEIKRVGKGDGGSALWGSR